MDRILVVEDDRELNQGICFALQQAGYETESAYSTQEAKLAGLQQEYSLMILDVNLPDGEGFGFCKWIMEHRKVKVMFLTARDLEEDVLSGYELGAEDYVTKPFSIHILLKKIAVILKRETENVLIVTHSGVLMALRCYIAGQTFEEMGIIRYKTKNAEVVEIFADDVKDAIARFKKGE